MTDFPEREADQLAGVPLPEYRQGVVGHEMAAALVRERLNAGRLPGGILLHGPRGIGKATLAFHLARAVFERTGDEPAHQIAEQVASGGYPNLFVLRRATRDTGKGFYTVIRVDEVRRFVEELRMTRGRGGWRIAIIDAVDDCNDNSANALLKILEEPPAETMFLLVSHMPGALLPTIRSRCLPIGLRGLSDEGVRQVLAATQSELGAEDLERAVMLAGGRPRKGFEALLLGDATQLMALRGWLADPLRSKPAAGFALAEVLGGDRDSSQLRFAREMINDALAGEAREAALNPGDRRRLASATELWDKARLSFADADEYNLDMRLTLTAIFDAIRQHKQLFTAPAP